MLIHITTKCRMGCTHCMSDCKPEGFDMDFDTFKKAVWFNLDNDPYSIIITGGEPMDHPQFWEFLDYAITQSHNYDTVICITTNGMAMSEDRSIYHKIKEINRRVKIGKKYRVMFQVTNVEKYYPQRIKHTMPVFSFPNVEIDYKIPKLYPQGRAAMNNMEPENVKGPSCFNIISLAHNTNSLLEVCCTLRSMGKFCTPSIMYNGDIHVGESDLCPSLGKTIYDKPEEIIEAIRKWKCNACGVWDMIDMSAIKVV